MVNRIALNIRILEEDLQILDDEATERKRETGNRQVGAATIIQDLIHAYAEARRKHPKQKPKTLFDAIEHTDAGVPSHTRSERKASSG